MLEGNADKCGDGATYGGNASIRNADKRVPTVLTSVLTHADMTHADTDNTDNTDDIADTCGRVLTCEARGHRSGWRSGGAGSS